MADELTPQETPMPSAGDKPPSGFRAFWATTVGKVVVVVGALTIVGALVAVAAVFIVGFLGARALEEAGEQAALQGAILGEATATAGVASEASTASAEATTIPSAVPISEVFAFRDIFDPLVADVPPLTQEATPPPIPGGLYLIDIVVEDGVTKAVLLWEDTRYKLAPAGRIPDTAWMVNEVRDDSVVMVYGDQIVVLRIGQGVIR